MWHLVPFCHFFHTLLMTGNSCSCEAARMQNESNTGSAQNPVEGMCVCVCQARLKQRSSCLARVWHHLKNECVSACSPNITVICPTHTPVPVKQYTSCKYSSEMFFFWNESTFLALCNSWYIHTIYYHFFLK